MTAPGMTLRSAVVAGLLMIMLPASSHDDTRGARFVDPEGVNATDCLEHHDPCRNIQFALEMAEPGNTVKVAAGIYDLSGVDPESFLFGVNHAQGGYEPGGHFEHQDPDAYPTILVGVDPRYRQAMMHLGFKWAADLASAQLGIVDDSPAAALQATAIAPESCVQGLAGQFPCRNVDFQSQISLNQFPSRPVSAANVWGFVDRNDGREYVVVGLSNGSAVVEVTDPDNPRQVVTIAGNSSTWREVKIYQVFDAAGNRFRAYAYITTEALASGLQVIDLSGLPNTATLATTLTDTGSQHTAYISNIDYATNMALPGREAYLYLAGSNLAGGGWRVYSLANPAQPQLIAAAPVGTQYVHDATSLLITDARTTQCGIGHNPCEVYVDFNENSVDLWDVTEKTAPIMLSSTTYSDASYTHSGWPTADQRHIFIHDETEEIFNGLFTQIYTMNVDDLRNPFIVASYQGPDTTTDHNGYTKGNLLYVSHYRRGLVVFDTSNPEALEGNRELRHFPCPRAEQRGDRWRLGRLSVPAFRQCRRQRHQQRLVRAARQRGRPFAECWAHCLCRHGRQCRRERRECASHPSTQRRLCRCCQHRLRHQRADGNGWRRLHGGRGNPQLARRRHDRPHHQHSPRQRHRRRTARRLPYHPVQCCGRRHDRGVDDTRRHHRR